MNELVERIVREDDENLYQPKIHSERIRELHIIVEDTKIPMTVLVDYAIQRFVTKYTEAKKRREQGLERIHGRRSTY